MILMIKIRSLLMRCNDTYEQGYTLIRGNIYPMNFLATESEVTPTIPVPIDYSIYRTPSGRDDYSHF